MGKVDCCCWYFCSLLEVDSRSPIPLLLLELCDEDLTISDGGGDCSPPAPSELLDVLFDLPATLSDDDGGGGCSPTTEFKLLFLTGIVIERCNWFGRLRALFFFK